MESIVQASGENFVKQCEGKLPAYFCEGVGQFYRDYSKAIKSSREGSCPNDETISNPKSLADASLAVAAKTVSELIKVYEGLIISNNPAMKRDNYLV